MIPENNAPSPDLREDGEELTPVEVLDALHDVLVTATNAAAIDIDKLRRQDPVEIAWADTALLSLNTLLSSMNWKQQLDKLIELLSTIETDKGEPHE